MTADIADTVAAVWRIESARLTAALVRRTGGDLGLAEDLAQDTFAAALRQWPVDGIPRHPGSWLMATAHHRLVDHARRRTTRRPQAHPVRRRPARPPRPRRGGDRHARRPGTRRRAHLDPDVLPPRPEPGEPDRAHPKVVAGLQTAEIARAFLVSETTAAQRIVRAKRRLATAGARFELPTAARPAGPAGRGARRGLRDLQRGVRLGRRSGLDPARALSRRPAPRPAGGRRCSPSTPRPGAWWP